MAIGTDSAIEFFGTQDTLGNTTSAVTDGSYSDGSNDLNTWTNDDDAPMAAAVLEVTYSTAPTANTSVSLFAALNDIEGTNDQLAPTDNFSHVFLGSFPVKDVTTAQYIPIDIGLPNTKSSQIYQFYVKNDAGQTMSAGWDLHITPKTIGPHA